MAREQFVEQKSIKITKETWRLLRRRSAEVERPMTALVEEAVVGYLAVQGFAALPPLSAPPPQNIVGVPALCAWRDETCETPVEISVRPHCLQCQRVVPVERLTLGPAMQIFCCEACRQSWLATVTRIHPASVEVPTLPICGWCQKDLPLNHGSAYCSVACAVAHSMEREGTPS